jgi:predicted acyl esterase
MSLFMRKILLTGAVLALTWLMGFAQNPIIPIPGIRILSDSIPKNGRLDRLEDLSLRVEVPFTMPDGVKLRGDVFLPIFQDSMTFSFDLLGRNVNLEVMKKGTQFIIYDSINGRPNPNPYQLPIIFTRTPYNKRGGTEAALFSILGYGGIMQDLRGRYASEGVFVPLYNDGWAKRPYYTDRHPLDITEDGSVHDVGTFEDGYHSLEFIKNSLLRTYDFNGDGVPDTTDLLYNGAIGMFGPSALGYSQTQAAAARKIHPTEPGLKTIFPIVASGEWHKSTVFPNGIFREMLVTGWLTGQIVDLTDNLIGIDDDLQNNIHTSLDYGLSNKMEVAERAIDSYSISKLSDGKSFQMPNAIGRKGFDIDHAPVDEHGMGDLNGAFNRYSNMEVPTYYLTGWYDIFVDGTFETFNKHRYNLKPELGNKDKVKLVVGPWAHQTITDQTSGDVTYPESVLDITKVSLSSFGDEFDLGSAIGSELFSWYRYSLNRAEGANVGEAKFFLPKSSKWQNIIQGVWVRFPSDDYKISYAELFNFLLGVDGLKGLPLQVRLGSITIPYYLDIPKMDKPLLPGVATQPVRELPTPDFTQLPPLRFYVIGPVNDGVTENEMVGNYWMSADTFPLANGIQYTNLFMHGDGKAAFIPPVSPGIKTYTHDPDNPVASLGGANMIGRTPVLNRPNQGQINYNNPVYRPFVLDRPDVLIFETDFLEDTLSMIGFPKAVIYATANAEGEEAGQATDIDFFVRIIDVYPDGRELFVVEGGVNARAREYARSIAEDKEDIHAPFTNIENGKLYEYYFNLLPIGYTFGKDHKVKIVLSSSNYQRYQSNPCIPLNEYEFFRRKPGEHKTYVFNGKEMTARKSVQQIYFSQEFPSRVILPVFGSTTVTSIETALSAPLLEVNIFPNPASASLRAYVSRPGEYQVQVISLMGQQLRSQRSGEHIQMDVSNLPAGAYLLQVTDEHKPEWSKTVKFIKN